MQFKPLILSIVSILITSSAMANELPPELPFQALDGTSLSPNQEGVAADTANTQNTSQGGAFNPNRMVNGTPESATATITPNPLEGDQPVSNDAQSAPAPIAEEKPKLKKRPKILDKAPESPKESASNKKQELDLGLQSGITIKPKPGRTESVIVAKGKLNRIVTPYAEPKVLTVDNVETKIDGSAVYIATDSETPVSMFISDAETGDAALLQLSPQELITPVEIRIEADASKAAQVEVGSSKTDRLFRQDSPYINEVKAVMQNLGKQQIPQGFTLEEVTDELRGKAFCHDPNLTYWAGQLLSGHDSRIVVLIGQNNGNATVIFEEAFCASEDTMAVAAWPKVRLEPGEKTEIYLLLRLPEGKSGEEIRPALL
ncbi:type-F conjugative transfer system secretin TraK [Methylomicrobium sp. Wu6]|uniref:TraK domain-containing protein n=1 Tax=Methylomicrobium sp. Wu6 TaxID=3107928 RepID=UPI002DD65550|nr:type-F conjugative transfer system secretin TraK [Methylomicrobium sp. Wu6]MEC4747580.1 type-F conjugative transfer system secretin TraK [Methylomicrobium sp. Wu6]